MKSDNGGAVGVEKMLVGEWGWRSDPHSPLFSLSWPFLDKGLGWDTIASFV